jgi:hypothetical protein
MVDYKRADFLLEGLKLRIEELRKQRAGELEHRVMSDDDAKIILSSREELIEDIVHARNNGIRNALSRFSSFYRFSVKLDESPRRIIDHVTFENTQAGNDDFDDPYFARPTSFATLPVAAYERFRDRLRELEGQFSARERDIQRRIDEVKSGFKELFRPSRASPVLDGEGALVGSDSNIQGYENALAPFYQELAQLRSNRALAFAELDASLLPGKPKLNRFNDYVTLRRILVPSEARPVHLWGGAEDWLHDTVSPVARGYFSDILVEHLLADDHLRGIIKGRGQELLLAKFQTTDHMLQIKEGRYDPSRRYYIVTMPLLIGVEDAAIRQWELDNRTVEELPHNMREVQYRFKNPLSDYVIQKAGERFGSRPPRIKISYDEYVQRVSNRTLDL